ncbi:MAG: hypothetical protein K2Q20_09210 [Phycisphaerales bacterium]|nr:hypothetical protein [Phycisphaerales bacterium]
MINTPDRRPLGLAIEHEPARRAGLSPTSALRVSRARRLIEAGFYDQPDVLEAALDRLLDRARSKPHAAAPRQIA